MEEKKSPESKWGSLSDVDLYTAEMPSTSTSEITSETDSSSTGDAVCIVCHKPARKSCLTCQASYCATCISPHHTVSALHDHKLVEATGKVEEKFCLQHYRELELFCRTDQIAICVVCLGKEHSGHDIISNKTDQNARERCFIRQLTNKCQKFKKSNPACYLLPTERGNISHNSVRRWSFGERDKSKPTKTILMVGETGTGKTTLINTMVNYMLGVKWEDRIWFHITEEEKTPQTKSQTSHITVYELFQDKSTLTIIDTPGYGATEGIQLDKKIEENLYELFRSEDGIHEIEVVGLVVKASQNRLTDFQNYIFNAILSLFGKDIGKKIVVFITHSDGLPAPNIITALNEAKVPYATHSTGEPFHFMFNNRQHESYDGEQEDLSKALWKLGDQSMKKFFDILEHFDKTEVNMTVGVLRERKRLEACVNHLQSLIKTQALKQNELQQIKTALQTNREEFEVDEVYKEHTPIEAPWWHLTKSAMCCNICQENCHYPGCWWVKNLSWCSVMRDDKCTVCTNKCPVSAHVKQRSIYVPQTRKVIKYAVNLKLQEIEKELNDTKAKLLELLDEAYQSILELDKIALKKHAFSTTVNLNILITEMKNAGEDEKVQKLQEFNKQIEASAPHQQWHAIHSKLADSLKTLMLWPSGNSTKKEKEPLLDAIEMTEMEDRN